MNQSFFDALDKALDTKQLNKVAYDKIKKWLTDPEFDEFIPQLTQEIGQNKWPDLLDKFYRVVEFGTGGIRGVMDIGTNRINNHTIRWTSQAFAHYLLKHRTDIVNQGVAIAYDSRNNSEEFMRQTATVLAANGIPVHIFRYYRATPELSFAVRHLNLAGGIVITASHNPPQFNGWKVYGPDGVQLLPDQGLLIEQEFKTISKITTIPFDSAINQKIITYISDDVDQAFLQISKNISVYSGRNAKIVFSPLHGVGSQNVLPALKEVGFKVSPVEKQMTLDGNFPTVKDHFPQPEFPVVYELAIEQAKQEDADLVLVSDPDADRLGMAVPLRNGEWKPLTGNQAAVVMAAFYLQQLKEQNKLPSKPVVIKTSVTTDLLRDVAESYGSKVIGDLLVGFKFICDRQEHLPEDESFVMGAEESIGYLFTNAYRDKGAETPAVVAAEMAAWLKSRGKTPLNYLEDIYEKHGYYAERLYYRLIEGLGAFDQMNMAMKKLRTELPKEVNGWKVVKYIDRLTGEVHDGQTGHLIETRKWDKGDMLTFFFSDDERTAIHVRPSGTEPKMKYYTMVKGKLQDKTKDQLQSEAESLEKAMVKIFEDILATIKIDVFA